MTKMAEIIGAFKCTLRKDWLLAKPSGRIEVVLTPEAAKIKISTVIPTGPEAGIAATGRAGKLWFALIKTGFCPLQR
jgi:hypothetical protein